MLIYLLEIFQKKFYKGDILVKKGELVEVIYFLKQGRVLGRDISVNETTFKDVEAKQGESFGERAIVMNAPAIATAECLTDGVTRTGCVCSLECVLSTWWGSLRKSE